MVRSASPLPRLTIPVLLGATLVVAGLGVGPTPAQADEIEDSLVAALDAYRAGDTSVAKEELDFAAQLLSQMKAEGLSSFLPAAQPGWTREDGETQALGTGLMGSGLSANATYRRDGDTVDIQFLADNPMVTAMAGMFTNPSAMGAMGTVKRIGRQKVVVSQDGELQALVNNRIMVQISGSAPVEDKEAYFEAIDIRGLQDF
ncbi:hypothetical protein F1188_10815 [Roseospira marina]|uniref:Uncharacterized protein n=1 Tax=Roseospira marina TaxID=140057 RepID=A0A5M6IBQ3_9PROT|nr:hypothetical protein [Roseospira marina]KAA5605387.1 hypothetical protein F1188_10815 [Roseospira marina]MBB4314626.1 hypothetical protein [Roseospira marina]MBB5088769.1 hypothetical protein [Roseospira marina]